MKKGFWAGLWTAAVLLALSFVIDGSAPSAVIGVCIGVAAAAAQGFHDSTQEGRP